MTIQLTPEHEAYIATKVREGRYPSMQAFVTDAIEILERRLEKEQKLADLRREIALGDADIEAGRYDEMSDELLDSIRQRALKNLGVAE